MTEKEKILKQFIAWPIKELSSEWFYVSGPSFPTWLHICRPHWWKELEEAETASEEHVDKLWFTSIPHGVCRKCEKPVPDMLKKLGMLLALGKDIK
jgi:hypothetical protein